MSIVKRLLPVPLLVAVMPWAPSAAPWTPPRNTVLAQAVRVPPPDLTGTIRSKLGPIKGATLTCTQKHHSWRAVADSHGAVQLRLAPGSYSCTATARGFHTTPSATVQVGNHGTTRLRVTLSKLPAPAPKPKPKPTATPLPTDTPSGLTGGPTCLWLPGATLFTDANAQYFQTSVRADPHVVLTVSGVYPAARFASIGVYTVPAGALAAGLVDKDFPPDPGSVNPFVAGTQRGVGQYTLRIVFGKRPASPAAGTLYADVPAGSYAVLIFRLYLPDAAVNGNAAAQLPTVIANDARSGAPSGCPLPDTAAAAPTAYPWQDTAPVTTTNLQFTRLGGATADFYGNLGGAYLGAYLPSRPKLYVVRFKVPTTPRTSAGGPIDTTAQVRYWSLCVFGYAARLVGCVNDEQAPVDANGMVTIVLGQTWARPPVATLDNGVVWIDLGTDIFREPFVAVLRELLPSPSFQSSALAVPVGAAAGPYMGQYAPTITVCGSTQFQTNRCAS